jgi:hypothetical protein
MNLREMDGKERVILIGGLILVFSVFAYSAYIYLNPPIQVWEGKVFDTWESSSGDTNILSYGEGKLKIPGKHDIELDATYRITYRSRSRNSATILISIEKIDG